MLDVASGRAGARTTGVGSLRQYPSFHQVALGGLNSLPGRRGDPVLPAHPLSSALSPSASNPVWLGYRDVLLVEMQIGSCGERLCIGRGICVSMRVVLSGHEDLGASLRLGRAGHSC